MYIIVSFPEVKRVGRPKREDKTERANLKLNSGVRTILKNLASLDGRSEINHINSSFKKHS
jgi:hypothetical protein